MERNRRRENPITPEKLKELASLPHGEAGKIIRDEVDPLWGKPRKEGLRTFKVHLEQTTEITRVQTGYVIVDAEDIEQAKKMAKNHPNTIWQDEDEDIDETTNITRVEEV